MSSKMRADESGEAEAGEAGWSVEREWAEARVAAGMGARPGGDAVETPAEISPFLLLYSGFLVGPVATLLLALAVGARQLRLRHVAAVVGIAGAGWCFIQGLTMVLAGAWPEMHLQFLRTAINFGVGLALLVYLWRGVGVSMAHDRQTLVSSLVVAGLLVIAFNLLPDAALVWGGR